MSDNKLKDSIDEKVDAVKEDVAEVKAKLKAKKADFEDAYNAKRKELQAEFREKMLPVSGVFGKIKLYFGQACDILDDDVLAKVRKSFIFLGGVLAVFLMWIL